MNGAIAYTGGLSNNSIRIKIGIIGPRPVGTMATYTCHTGYTLTGDSVRVCQNDRKWSGSTPTCQGEDKINSYNSLLICMHACAVSCGPPPSITNGSSGQPTSTMIGGEVTYTCVTGYLLTGSERITCLSTGNWSSSPSCQSKYTVSRVIFVWSKFPYVSYCRASYEK